MTSSLFEIPSSSPKFGFILRDRNHRNDQNAVVSQKKFVKDQNLVDSWVKNQNKNNEESKRNDKTGASSLVQIWEARLNQSSGGNSPRDSGLSVVQETYNLESPSVDGDSDPTVEIESDSENSKWGRVADLIRRLSNDQEKQTNGENGVSDEVAFVKTPRLRVSSLEIGKSNSNFPVVNFSPKIRGRQAFNDLLMRLERDRYRELEKLIERKAVCKFTQRGRLQTMLRLKNLERCQAIQDRTRSTAKITELNRKESGSTVLHLREKFCANSAAAKDQRKIHHGSGEMNKEAKVTTESPRLKKKGGETLEAFFAERLSLYNRDREEEATLRKEEVTVKETKTVESEMNCLQLQETRDEKEEAKTSPSMSLIQELQLRQNQLESCRQETQKTQGVVHESNEMDQCLEKQEMSYSSGWEEQEEYEDEQYYYGEANNEWLSEISRPRSYWEELRKSRYLEVMNTPSEKEDIRRLLERRTVTDFLESGLREKIDNLMMCRVQTHSSKHPEKWESEQEEEHKQKNESEEEEPLTEDDRDDSSRSSSSPMFASSPAGSWSSQDTGVTSTPVQSPQDHHSPEMEMISGMRSQIQQLQQEMSLLRDSVKTCLDANASLQQSVRENPLKRSCRVCDETQVEAVFYKCGHMCTCLKCANELQCNGGKCPICRAQILDVVRVFFDTRN